MQPPFVLSQSDGRPMYLQIIEQIRLLVAVGDWNAGFKLPSIRELAVALRVSVITVKRAYQELESDGVIFTQQGKGSFVAETDKLDQRLKREEMKRHLERAIEVARTLGLTAEDAAEALRGLWPDNAGNNEK